MKYFFLILTLIMALPVQGQTKKINALKSQKAKMEKGIKDKQVKLDNTRKQAVKKEQTADFIEDQLQSRLDYIHRLERDIDTLDNRVNRLEQELLKLEEELGKKKEKYRQSLRYARNSQDLRNPLLFILSAESFPQIYRRMRYAREFAALQKNLGIQLMAKQQQVRSKQNELLAAKQQMSNTVQEVIKQRRQLTREHSIVRANAQELRKRQKQIEKEVAEQQKQLNELSKKIDELVAYEIEQARKRAEAEARRKQEAEAKKKGQKGGKSTQPTQTTKGGSPSKWLTAEDKQLNGSLEQNKGRLPVPITGPYRVERRFGLTHITSSVVLDNKGVNYQGQEGARARAIFDGEVSAVFQLGNLKNVLVRHGSYISVYCNLSSTIVTRGQKVKARDILGTVAANEKGNFVLHFQLRKETEKLNPEKWIGR